METIVSFMEGDHDRLDQIFQNFQKAKNTDPQEAKNLFHEFRMGLRRHIVWEEEILFPLFEEKTGMTDTGPTAVMRMEHEQIKGYMDQIFEKINAEDFATENLEQSLVDVLTAHNEKEESILYPAIEDMVNPAEREQLLAKMKELPPEKYHDCC